nr:hypothetical protein [Tanacetum cinerariifolium]
MLAKWFCGILQHAWRMRLIICINGVTFGSRKTLQLQCLLMILMSQQMVIHVFEVMTDELYVSLDGSAKTNNDVLKEVKRSRSLDCLTGQSYSLR